MNQQPRKVAVITGAARGLGLALALELAGRGFDLALIDKDETGLRLAQEIFDEDQQTISIHLADVSVESELQAVRDEILEAHGRIDWLINNAGVSISQPFEMIRQEDFDWLFDTNFWGAVYCCRHFLPELKKSQEARIINVCSVFGYMGLPGKSAYAASKAALIGFSQVLNAELHQSGIKVSIVIPPPLSTNIVSGGLHVNEEARAAENAFLNEHGLSLEWTARRIVSQIEEGKFRIVPGFKTRLAEAFSRSFPSWTSFLVRRMKMPF